ncbi:vWA domain-containing protein [Pseudosulfitobacter pseudonitzschiae]|uniref:vWA domain-containing protein n=1 Tax=Pseudosulfitobacter pseudonitzschiae TaxID=1402135 RepID=UPI001AF4E038|nr:VWA domain-containing protein [Pseudosulfitobacter pseudonitzschiae]MBM1814451.1 VWA domain-containing protein [Pseudosulfitobacter pseudonitzschiae]MBM1831444.1 VWA domain-containing protein [Pseudosulfitobacter pseudonitzschiae]MBM1836311.1 VWA domain-containing protein [Pseudosulfitobacter pseudonitzschiae]MBM1841157.1 VWA domain-containing protein [Pseudosulfitobacter pseudonitzschiae]MBM1846025.1 VWA domain-containing protein [Pseudosulfitobacter pseudonitzschiae]
MRYLLAVISILGLLAQPLLAQDRANTILVLDGSGSMWGQIDDVAKITIAQEVVGKLLSTIPNDQQLGLTVYGHRTRGDCTDIETLVAPGPDTRDAISTAVRGIKPLGKTPMTDAVIAAAQALRYTEEKATVILVSDGIETCNPDPCAAARLLEEAGIDFTAHVIGFDVTDAEALAQMQCLAEETGGTFLTASDADELTAALTTVATEPAPVPVPAILHAVEGDANAPLLEDPVLWTMTGPDGTVVATDQQVNPLVLDVLPGAYTVTAYRIQEETEQKGQLQVLAGANNTLTVVFEKPAVLATLEAAESAPMGSDTQVKWQGPAGKDDYIAVVDPLDDSGRVINYTYVRDGNPVSVTMPPREGTFELRYYQKDRTVIGTRPITVTPVTALLEATETAPAGADLAVTWQGPDYKRDFIAVGEQGKPYINYAYTSKGSPAQLQMPTQPGTYELRYVMDQDRTTIATRMIQVVDVTATVTPPAQATVGATIAVPWEGPDYKRDFIAVGKPGEPYINYAYTRNGTPAQLLMPTEPGDYEVRYVLDQDREIIATAPITLVAVAANVSPPAKATAGAMVAVPWEGPDYTRDFIAVGKPGEPYVNYAYTSNGNPAQVQMPVEPGDYEVRYVLDQDREIIATAMITVEAASASVTPPATATAGAMVAVPWEGPDYTRDFIAVGKPGEPYVNYAYTSRGNPAQVQMPVEPGDYEIRYVLDQDREIIATAMITISAVTAHLTPPQAAPVGATVAVPWIGPDYTRDFIAVGKPDEPYINYAYTKDGNPARVEMPATPGDYELRYVLDQDNLVIATVPLTVTDVTVTLNAPASGAAGKTIAIPFDGPGYARDYIGIGAPGSVSYETYVYAKKGEIAQLKLPETPGDYELFYMMDEGNRVMARQPFTVTP